MKNFETMMAWPAISQLYGAATGVWRGRSGFAGHDRAGHESLRREGGVRRRRFLGLRREPGEYLEYLPGRRREDSGGQRLSPADDGLMSCASGRDCAPRGRPRVSGLLCARLRSMRGALSREGFPSAQVVVKTRDRYPPARTTSAGTRKARPCLRSLPYLLPRQHLGHRGRGQTRSGGPGHAVLPADYALHATGCRPRHHET